MFRAGYAYSGTTAVTKGLEELFQSVVTEEEGRNPVVTASPPKLVLEVFKRLLSRTHFQKS